MKNVDKFRMVCYGVWVIVEPILLVLLIMYANKVIRLFEGLQ